jgi:hypothetical protein
MRFEDLGRWVVTVWSGTRRGVISANLVVAGLLLRPHSPYVTPGKAYPLRLYTHCGANFDVDFDHAFWDLTDPNWGDQPGGAGPHQGLGNPFQSGTMTLIDPTHARFDFVSPTWATGTPGASASIRLTRRVGPKIVPGYCA